MKGFTLPTTPAGASGVATGAGEPMVPPRTSTWEAQLLWLLLFSAPHSSALNQQHISATFTLLEIIRGKKGVCEQIVGI